MFNVLSSDLILLSSVCVCVCVCWKPKYPKFAEYR